MGNVGTDGTFPGFSTVTDLPGSRKLGNVPFVPEFVPEAAASNVADELFSTRSRAITLEDIRPSRNLVGHMNFPNAYDRTVIDGAHGQLPNLVARLRGQNIPIAIP